MTTLIKCLNSITYYSSLLFGMFPYVVCPSIWKLVLLIQHLMIVLGTLQHYLVHCASLNRPSPPDSESPSACVFCGVWYSQLYPGWLLSIVWQPQCTIPNSQKPLHSGSQAYCLLLLANWP